MGRSTEQILLLAFSTLALLAGCCAGGPSGANKFDLHPTTFDATVSEASFKHSSLKLQIHVRRSTLQDGPTVLAQITLTNVSDHSIDLIDFDPYLRLRDSNGKSVMMTDFGLGHFFNQDKAGSNFGTTFPPNGARSWTADIRRCFYVQKGAEYKLDVEYDPGVLDPNDQLSNFGFVDIPISFP